MKKSIEENEESRATMLASEKLLKKEWNNKKDKRWDKL